MDRNGVGFRVAGFWDKVIDLNECHLQAEPSNAQKLQNSALEHKLEFLILQRRFCNLIIRISSTGEIMTLSNFTMKI